MYNIKLKRLVNLNKNDMRALKEELAGTLCARCTALSGNTNLNAAR